MKRRIDLLNRAQKNLEKTIVIGGIGNLGSRIAHNLAKQSFGKLILIDYDKVENVNVGYQEYGKEDVGLPKVVALKKHLENIYQWVEVEAYNIYIAGLGGFILSEEELKEQDLKLREIVRRCDCVVATFDQIGPRLTLFMYALVFHKPILFVSAWSSRMGEGTTLSHHGRINIWKPGLPCYFCYVYPRFPSENRIYVAHPMISGIVSSLGSYLVEAILWDIKVYPYIIIDYDEEKDAIPRIEYLAGEPSKKCPICSNIEKIKKILDEQGLIGIINLVEEVLSHE